MGIVKIISEFAIIGIFLIILSSGILNRIKVFEVFIDGAKDGISSIIKILPSLVGLLVAIAVIRASGALDLIAYIMKPFATFFGVPTETLPLAILRPISGSASLAMVSDILSTYGPNSFIGRVASTMMGSTETIFYTLTVYFACIGIKNIRYTLYTALAADLVSVLVSSWICKIFF